LNTQLSQLKVKIDKSKTYLDKSNNLSQDVNSDISSLEKRKNTARQTLDLYTDIVELRGSILMVKEALKSCEDNQEVMEGGL
jgi:chromosome segregation ATPase